MDIHDQYFTDWSEREAIAESMLPLIGKLYRDHGVITSVYGKSPDSQVGRRHSADASFRQTDP